MEIKSKEKRIMMGTDCFYLAFIAWFSTEMLVMSTVERVLFWSIQNLNSFTAALVLSIMIIQIVAFQDYSHKELFIIVLFTIPIMLSAYNSEHRIWASSWLFIVASKYIDINKMIDTIYKVQIIGMSLIFMLFATGQIHDIVTYRGNNIRHACGFSHANFLGMMIFQLIVMRFYIKRVQISMRDIALLAIAILFTYAVPNSLSAVIVMIIFLVMTIIYLAVRAREAVLYSFCKFLIFLMTLIAALSVLISCMDIRNSKVLKSIDQALSWRFSAGHMALKHYGITLFGQNIYSIVKRPIIGWTYNFFLDNSYMAILLRYGAIILILFMVIYISAMFYFLRQGNYYLVIILFLYGIYGVMETNLFSISKNIFLLALAYPIYSKAYKEETECLERRRRIVFTM